MIYKNDLSKSSDTIDFHLFADDSNLFFSHKTLQSLETPLNEQLCNINKWLCANKLSLNTDKLYFVVFHPPQKKVSYSINLKINLRCYSLRSQAVLGGLERGLGD